MEKKAADVGVGGKLHYLFPSGWDAKPQGVNATDAPKAASLKLGDRLLCDLHVTVWGHDGPVEPQLDGDGSISVVLTMKTSREIACDVETWLSPRQANGQTL